MGKVKQIEVLFIQGLRRGDPNSYEKLYVNYYNDLCFFLSKIVTDRALCKDLVQEVFLNIWNKRTELQIKTSLKKYLYKSVYNQYLMHLREQKKQRSLLETLKAEAIYEYYEADTSAQELRVEKLRKAIDQLPPKCKQAFVLSRFEDRKYKEIATLMGISPKTVEIHISKALGLLRKIQFFF
ncbi:RNA polymerase sigma-70 factor [Ascidiimonas sp. W6]|uniref:RNA polymerase sigma factor n=1 Tax=Ascidiimonas meishanensis TaxID=3128903 RepID=UPI0030ED7B05